MIIRKYGLLLREVEREDLEMIRQYRNSTAVKDKMIYRKTITREQQKKWFKEILELKHTYFIIYKDDVAMGLINGRNIDYINRTSEGGIFIWSPNCSHDTTVLASIIMNDWSFTFNNFRMNFAEVLKSNKKAIAYNKAMGYKVSERLHSNPDVLWMTQSKEDYHKFRAMISKIKINGYDLNDSLKIEDLSLEDWEVDMKLRIINQMPEQDKSMFLKMMEKR